MNNENNLNCSICLDTLYKPLEHRLCGNMFCEECIAPIKSCPICRESFKKDSLTPVTVRMILGAISDIHFECQECHQKVLRIEEKDHKPKCEIICTDCGKRIPKDALKKHQENECPAFCRKCLNLVSNLSMEEHLKTECVERNVDCLAKTDECEWQGKAKELFDHLIVCKLCKCRQKYKEQIEVLEGTVKSLRMELVKYQKSEPCFFQILGGLYQKSITYSDNGYDISTSSYKASPFYLESVSSKDVAPTSLNNGSIVYLKAKLPDGRIFYLERTSKIINTPNNEVLYNLGFWPNPTQYWRFEKVNSSSNEILSGDEVILKVNGDSLEMDKRDTVFQGTLTIDNGILCVKQGMSYGQFDRTNIVKFVKIDGNYNNKTIWVMPK